MLGLSGDSKIFNVDMREDAMKINHYHIKELLSHQRERNDEFQSLRIPSLFSFGPKTLNNRPLSNFIHEFQEFDHFRSL